MTSKKSGYLGGLFLLCRQLFDIRKLFFNKSTFFPVLWAPHQAAKQDSDTHLPICSCVGIALQQSIFYRSRWWIHLYVVPAMNLLIYSEKPRAPILQPSILMLFSHYLSRQLERSVAREHSILLTTLDFSYRHFGTFLSSNQYRGPVSRPLASHAFSTIFWPFVRSGGGEISVGGCTAWAAVLFSGHFRTTIHHVLRLLNAKHVSVAIYEARRSRG